MPKNVNGFERTASVTAGAALPYDRGIRIEETVTIQASPQQLFEFCRKPDTLVRVFPHLERVEPIDQIRSHWVMGGPGGTTVEWDARITNEIPGEEIAWKSLPGSNMVSAGSITFRPLLRSGTQVSVVMQYDLPTGKLAAALAWLVGRSPDVEVREALRRLKQLIETGGTTGYRALRVIA
jgi:uncharacterized membrane protein